MWGRIIEILLGLWLILSPFIFGHHAGNPALWTNDLVCGTAVIILAFLSFWPWPVLGFMRYAHLGILGVGGWLTLFGYVASGHLPGGGNDSQSGRVAAAIVASPFRATGDRAA
jgi:hypothetical protein